MTIQIITNLINIPFKILFNIIESLPNKYHLKYLRMILFLKLERIPKPDYTIEFPVNIRTN